MNIPSVKQLQQVRQPVFKNRKGQQAMYGELSKKDLIRVCYIYGQEAQKFFQGMELFKKKYTSLILLHETQCPKCAHDWATFGEVVHIDEEPDAKELDDK